MKRMRMLRQAGLYVGALALAAATAAAPVRAAEPESIRFLTGSAGGGWYPLTVGMAEILSKAGARTSTEIGGGNSNVINIANGNGDIGVTFTVTAAAAAQGEAPFKSEITSLRGLFMVANNIVHMVTSQESGIQTVPDLKGRPVALQQQSAGVTSIFRMILDAYGMSEDDLDIVTRGGTGQASAALKDRRADFYVSSGTVPEGAASEVAASLPIRFLPVDDEHFAKIQAMNSGFLRSTLAAGTYTGQDEAVPGVGAPIFVISNESLPDDHAYWIVKTLVENIEEVRKIHQSLASITPEFMASFGGADMHPGAARYYREIGVLK